MDQILAILLGSGVQEADASKITSLLEAHAEKVVQDRLMVQLTESQLDQENMFENLNESVSALQMAEGQLTGAETKLSISSQGTRAIIAVGGQYTDGAGKSEALQMAEGVQNLLESMGIQSAIAYDSGDSETMVEHVIAFPIPVTFNSDEMNSLVESIEAEYQTVTGVAPTKLSAHKLDTLVESVMSFAADTFCQWALENAPQIEQAALNESIDDFVTHVQAITGLKMDTAAQQRIQVLTEANLSLSRDLMETQEELSESKEVQAKEERLQMIAEATEGLSDVGVERLLTLLEGVEIPEDKFEEKLQQLVESISADIDPALGKNPTVLNENVVVNPSTAKKDTGGANPSSLSAVVLDQMRSRKKS